ncbi:MAG: ATP-binding protein [Gaiellaceae bacterium]
MGVEAAPPGIGFSGGGELGELIRSFDWKATSIGPIEEWPDSLRTAVRIMLASSQPIWIGWGDDLVYLYNDAYKSIIGGKHPEMLGRPTRVVWSEIWDVIDPMLQTALTSEQGTYVESQLLIMERYGYREETYYTFSYSPIPGEDGRARGIICVNTDDTQRRIGERQLSTLGELAARTAEVLTPTDVCHAAAEALATNPLDLPFGLLYLAADDDAEFVLAGASGVEPGHPTAPTSIERASDRAMRLAQALGRGEIMVVDDLQSFFPTPAPKGAWSEPPTKAAFVPLAPAGGAQGYGVLVVGLNPHRLFDTGYSDFLSLIGRQISSSLATAFAYDGERRRAEALAQLDEAKTQFFSNVSHEFRTPLTLMLGPLEDAAEQPGPVVEIDHESLALLRRNALRLLRMVNTILDFSRVSSAEALSVFRRVDLEELTREVGDHFRPLMERSGIEFDLDISPLPEPAYVDPEAWEKIVLNLLSNAFKFTMRGRIQLALAAVDGAAELRVSDTGTGIPRDERPHLFERFHRVRNDQARTHEGTGIGVALVRELVELHGGTVRVDSTLGEGTTFTIAMPLGHRHLPPQRVSHELVDVASGEIALAYTEEAGRWSGIEADTALTPTEGPADGDRSGDARVVVVDDNADMRDYMVRLLERHWAVDSFADGQSALEAIRRDPPRVVVTDVMMPRLDGFGLLAALREDAHTAPIPVIVVSARAGEESSVEGLHAGADDYLVKPFSARELGARVRANLELARLRAEAGRLAALEDVRARVVTTVSHELRTPVTAIFGASRTLEQVAGLDEQTRHELLQVIMKETERLARITNDILTTESLAGGMAIDLQPVDVKVVVADAVRAAEAGAPPGTQISTSFPGEPVRAAADGSRLQQVVTNLLDNAIKYSPADAEIEARLLVDDGHVTIEVVDQGVGIPEEARDHVFRRFYRVDPTLTGGVGGSGLGLYISRQLVEAMGGSIRVDGNEPRGSRFVVKLPRAAPA